MAEIDAVIVRKSKGPAAVALVSAECDPDMITCSDDLFGAISESVGQFVGDKKRQDEPSFTVEEVRFFTQNENAGISFREALKKCGVSELTVDIHVGDRTSWDFDDNFLQREE